MEFHFKIVYKYMIITYKGNSLAMEWQSFGHSACAKFCAAAILYDVTIAACVIRFHRYLCLIIAFSVPVANISCFYYRRRLERQT